MSDEVFARKSGETDLGVSVTDYDAPELSEEDFAESTANAVANAFEETKLFESLEVQSTPDQISIMGRVRADQEGTFVERVVTPILKATDSDEDCGLFVGKQYILKKGETRYAWVISIASSDLKGASTKVVTSFDTASRKREVMESPLVGNAPPQTGKDSGRPTGRGVSTTA